MTQKRSGITYKKAVKLVDGLNFAEGPLWHPDGFLLISDTGANEILKITPQGEIETYLAKSGGKDLAPHANPEKPGSNGLKWQRNKKPGLVMCRQAQPGIAMYDGITTLTLTDSFKGRPYNSPNDLVIRSNGVIYFSDPPYGVEEEKLLPEFRQPCAGVYAYENGNVRLLFSKLNYPNGVCLSPDEAWLYISSNHPDEPFIYKLSLKNESEEPTIFTPNNADGILCDKQGNIFTASGNYVHKYNSKGERVNSYFIGEGTSNLTCGGPTMKDLYVSCYHSIYCIQNVFE